jgi:hypothetical protein
MPDRSSINYCLLPESPNVPLLSTFNINFPLPHSYLYVCQVVRSLGSEDLFAAPGSPSEDVIAQETEAAKAIIQDSRLRKVRDVSHNNAFKWTVALK